ncbi:MAG TPA: biopolymer transporter ExbD [Longimicrobiaceae bacterium]|nr:biopolymer transporter ExbD [Longimicrobiaceae bacterium]
MPRRRSGGSDFNLSAEINVTSLVDVAFTLLVIFIITAPILQGGVEVKVPKAQTEAISSPEGVIVTVTREGKIYIGNAPATWGEFPRALADVVEQKQVHALYLKADEGVPYGQVLRVLGAMKALDIGSVGLVAEPEQSVG